MENVLCWGKVFDDFRKENSSESNEKYSNFGFALNSTDSIDVVSTEDDAAGTDSGVEAFIPEGIEEFTADTLTKALSQYLALMKDSLLDLKEKGSGLVDSHNILSYTLDIGYNLVIRIHPGYRMYFSN